MGALIGSQYEELSDTPRGRVVMSRNMYLGISRRTTESALEILEKTGYVPREGSANALPTEGTRWAVRARLLEFDLSVRRRMVSYVELTLLFVWEVVDLRNNSVVYSRGIDSELETEFVGDQDGTFIFAVRRGFEQALSQLLRDDEFQKVLSIGSRIDEPSGPMDL